MKRTRTLIGIVLIIVNSLLSLTSFLAVYSAVFFVRDANNYQIDTGSFSNGLNASTPYIYLGEIRVNNSGLFAFSEFRVSFSLSEANGSILAFEKEVGVVAPNQVTIVPLNLTASEGAVLNTTMNFIPTMWVNASATLLVGGKYAFGLFDFSIFLNNLTSFFGV